MLSEKVKPMKKGLLIAIEGIDGAGKTTQAQALKTELQGRGLETVDLKEPTKKGVWGERIDLWAKTGRTASTEEEFVHFLEDRKFDVRENIKPALDKGKIVIMDRYYFSSVAYQGAKGMDPSFVENENLKFAPKPDIVLLLDITTATAKRRIEKSRGGGTNHFEQRLGPVRSEFLKIAKTHQQICVIDGEQEVSKVFAEILSKVNPLILKYEE